MITNKSELCKIIKHDHYRVYKRVSIRSLISGVIFGESFKYVFWLRVSDYFDGKNKLFYILSKLILRHYKFKFTICIPHKTSIGKGFYIGHFGSIFISRNAVIGDNCNISQGVTIGQISQGVNRGAPKIGNNVYIGPGAKIIGNVTIGDNVAIGANAVVTKDVTNNNSVGGVPAAVISSKGSEGYINNILEIET